MTFTFENDIKTDYDGYAKLLKLLHKAENSSDTEIIFDFSKVIFFEANLCAVLATITEILENKGKNISLINFNKAVEAILRKNEFLLSYGYKALEDRYRTAIMYRKFNPINKEDDNNFELYIENQLLNKDEFPSHSRTLGKHITQNIFELYENARTHGSCEFIHACGQYFPNKPEKPLNITIVDTGKNFKDIVSDFLNEPVLAVDSIEWAMRKGNTTKSGDMPGGLGLDLIFQFIKHNNGKIQIISSNGFWEWHRGNTTKKSLDHTFYGTIANLRFNLNDQSYYSLASESDDWDNLF